MCYRLPWLLPAADTLLIVSGCGDADGPVPRGLTVEAHVRPARLLVRRRPEAEQEI